MRKLVFLLVFVHFSIFFTSLALASIYTCDSSGNEKTGFYTNDTIYVASKQNITNESKTIKFYVSIHRTWSSGTNLTQASNFSKNINTNSSGHVPITVLWSPVLKIGNYDVVADVNDNGTLDSEDLIYNSTGNGFSVLEQPVPRLTISKGSKSPSDHDFYEANLSLKNEMLQVRLQAGNYEGINVKSFYISAFGSGNDKNIKYVAVCEDYDEDGVCGFGEDILGVGQYGRDDGIAQIDLRDLSIAENSSLSLIFYYFMGNSSGSYSGETYSFQLVMVEAYGSITGNRAVVEGLPIDSALKTVYSEVTTTTTTSTTTLPTTTTSTTTLPTTTTKISEEGEERLNLFFGLAIAIFIAIAMIAIFYFFFLKPPQQAYTYRP
ncbi:MAG: hypothetical protein QW423_00830 [Candidatus Aenigmatarchaeota archaeon]